MIDTKTLPPLLGETEGMEFTKKEGGQLAVKFVETFLSHDLNTEDNSALETAIDDLLSCSNPRSAIFIVGSMLAAAMKGHATAVVLADHMFHSMVPKMAMKSTRETMEAFSRDLGRTLEQFRCHPHAVMWAATEVDAHIKRGKEQAQGALKLVETANETFKH